MPSDANGVYSLPSGYLAVTGETIQSSQHNPPLEDLASSMSARLMRSGAAPMTGPLKITDGSVGSPSVQLANGSSTGLYKTTNGIGISIAGTKVAEFAPGGMISGARWIGELVPFTGLTAPALTVLPFGQTLSRTTYADLWAFAQAEIAAGNTFYNNGNGSTTFGIGDMRGRVVAGKDNMGGTSASRLGSGAGFGGVANPAILGAAAGSETHALTTAQLAVHSHPNFLTDPGHSHTYFEDDGGSFHAGGTFGGIQIQHLTGASVTNITITNASAGSGAEHNNVQPTMITNYVLFAGA